MKITLNALSVVAAIAQAGSINKAAGLLHRAPSTVWYAVKKLERDLDLSLMERRGRGVVLTAACKLLLERAQPLLEMTRDLERSLRRAGEGWESTLRIAIGDVVPDEWIVTILSELQSVAPATNVTITREALAGAWDSIRSDRADLVIGAPSAPPTDTRLSGILLGDVHFLFVAAPTHPLATAREPLTPAMVGEHPAVVVADTTRATAPMSVGVLAEQSVIRVPDFRMKHLILRGGLAAGSLPAYLVNDDIQSGRLVTKLLSRALEVEPFWMGWRRDRDGRALKWLRGRVEETRPLWLQP